jgi:glutamine synthetase
VLFEGDGYSEEWEKEAKKRGLSNVKTTPYALDFYNTKKAKEVLVATGIYTARELEARVSILHHTYVLKIETEARILADIAVNQIVPAGIDYMNTLLANISGLKAAGVAAGLAKSQKETVTQIATSINAIQTAVDKMVAAAEKAHKAASSDEASKLYCDKVKPYFDEIREHADLLETIIDDKVWPLPKYREMLFIR